MSLKTKAHRYLCLEFTCPACNKFNSEAAEDFDCYETDCNHCGETVEVTVEES